MGNRYQRFSQQKPTSPNVDPNLEPTAGIDRLNHVRQLAQPAHVERKALQLCRQVERIVSLVISGELDDDLLRNLFVQSVVPAPHTSHLLITLVPDGPVSEAELLEMNARAARHNGAIRTAIATAIQRRKAPQISIRVIPSGIPS